MERYQLRVDGEPVELMTGSWYESSNPYTGQAWAEIPQCDARDVEHAVQAAHRAFTTGPWAEKNASQRGMFLHRLGDLIARDGRRLAETEVRDNGKLFAEMLGHLKCVHQWYYYFGGLADKVQGAALPLDKRGFFSFTGNEPLGVVEAITPWNSPLLLASWKIAPALAAGCSVVVKPSEFTSASTLEFAELFDEAGFPPRGDQRRDRLRKRGGISARRTSFGAENQLHRLGGHGPADQRTGGTPPQAHLDGTGRDVPQHRVRGCGAGTGCLTYMATSGGYKDSGLGRENGIDAIREYQQVKSVWINTGAVASNPFVMR